MRYPVDARPRCLTFTMADNCRFRRRKIREPDLRMHGLVGVPQAGEGLARGFYSLAFPLVEFLQTPAEQFGRFDNP
jgi:hypothetical protein